MLFLDALRLRNRDEGTIRDKAVTLGLGVRMAGTKEVLRPWIEQNERGRYGAVIANWRQHWGEMIPEFAFAPETLCPIYTTNAIESPRSRVEKELEDEGAFPRQHGCEQAAALGNPQHRDQLACTRCGRRQALKQFYILFSERLQGVTRCPSRFSHLHWSLTRRAILKPPQGLRPA